jgi:hypothetical protein
MPASLDRLVELLFKYRPSVFEHGRLALDAPRPVVVAVLVAALLAAAVVAAGYWRVRHASAAGGLAPRSGAGRASALLAALRLGAVALLAFCLLRPVLVLASAVPGRNTVAVLVDDSRSMRVADQDGRARGEWAARSLGAGSPLLAALERQFTVRVYRFSRAAERVPNAALLAFAGDRSYLGAALERVRADLAELPLAGVVVVTDGADGDPAALERSALALRARGAPLFTVGVGAERARRDLEVARVEAPRSALKGASVAVDVVVAHTGFGGRTVPLVVEDGGRVVARRDVRLPDEGATPVRIQLPAAEAGARQLAVRLVPQDGEASIENNQRELLMRVADRERRVLYFEGEPRYELKFVRRAVADDANLRVVALQRTAEAKYLRLGVRDSLDLVSGFPTTREELFSYQAVILGSVEASAFTPDQLRMLADFVSERGGGLLMLGGRRGLAEGGYAGTALADVIPVVLEPAPGAEDAPVTELAVRPTVAGAAQPALQLGPDARASAERWRTLPPLTAVNLVRRAKPGATVLLTGVPSAAPGAAAGTQAGPARVVLAAQRFGRGRAAAFAVQDSWLWQMHATVSVTDLSHELFWRQLLRWLVSEVPDAVSATASLDRPAPDEAVVIRAEVRDSAFVAANGARVVARVRAPSGAETELPLEWGVERDGEYRGSFTPTERGVHELRVTAAGAASGAAGTVGAVARDLGAAEPVAIDVADARDEYFGASMRAPLLRRLAAETGGRFYTPATVDALPEELRYTASGVTVTERRELWDMPAIFLTLGALLAGEWAYRRRRGLA